MSSQNNKTSLLEISQRLSHQNLSDLKSLASLSKFDAERIKDGMGLFDKLKERDGLGPGNYEYLRSLLQTIGRKDLASRLPDDGRVSYWYPWCTPTFSGPSSIGECHVPTMAEREILQRVLQDLGEDDVDNLVYIYTGADGMSKQAAEGIKSPCQFLRAITNYELLNFDRLCSHLHSIRRTDIACRLCQQLLCLPPPDVPTSCKGPRQLIFMKRHIYVTNVEELQPVEGNKVMWNIHFEEACEFLKQIFQSLGLASLFSVACTGKEISSSLEEAFECVPLYVKAHGIVVSREAQALDPVELQEPVHGYIQHFNAFKCLVQSDIETWRQNRFLARAIGMLDDSLKTGPGERQDKEAQHARKACEAIQEVGELLYGRDHMASEHNKARQHIKTMENYCYSSRYWLQIVPWFCVLLCVDLGDHTEVLQRIVTKQWDDIVRGYSSVSEAVGVPLLEELAEKMPGLELPTCSTYKSSLSPVEILVSPAYVFSVLLAGKALKCPSVNIPKVGTWLVKWLEEERGHQVEIGIEANVKTTFGMQRVVEELRRYLLNFCDEHGDRDLKRYIETALPGPVSH